MSATVFGSRSDQNSEQKPTEHTSDEPNNNNNIGEDRSNKQARLQATASARKRPSMQSSSSVASSNGNSSSATTSGSSQAGDDDDDDDNNADAEARQKMSNEEYEHIRNTTLLFFLDRLYLASHEGKEARTLHDLSCLFGTREFTKEMRQIVGASRNGLKKFLQSYPSLFQIEDDKVYLTQLTGNSSQVSQRDYNKEAVEYFKQKLLQFGTSLVPIKNLFGYRSQASQEVRHVSGKNSRDFKRFLKQNDDVFEILANEHVVLKSALRELESQGLSSLSLQQSLQPLPAEEATTLDPYLNKQLAHLVEDCIRKLMSEQVPPVQEHQFKVTLEHLHEIIQKHCQNELFLKMVKTIEDFKVFLRMHPKLFKRIPVERQQNKTQDSQEKHDKSLEPCSLTNGSSSYYVGLVTESERRELEAQAQRASNLLHRQQCVPDEQPGSIESTSISSEAAAKARAATTPANNTNATSTTATSANATSTGTKTTASSTIATSPNTGATDKQKHQRQLAVSVGQESKTTNKSAASTNSARGANSHADDSARERPKSTRSERDASHLTPASSSGGTSKRPEENQIATRQRKPPLLTSQSADRPTRDHRSHHQASPISYQHSASHKLRANAPPFVPSKSHSTSRHQHNSTISQNPHHHHHSQQPSPSSHAIQRQNSLLTQCYRSHSTQAATGANTNTKTGAAMNNGRQQQQSIPPAPIQRSVSSLNPPLRSYHSGAGHQVEPSHRQYKWGADLAPSFDRRAPIRGGYTLSSNQQHFVRGAEALDSLPAQRGAHYPEGGLASLSADVSQEDLRARTVDIVREASNIITKIMTTTDAVAFDCKGYNLGFDGKITLIQFGFLPTKNVDPMQLASSMNKRFAATAPTMTAAPSSTTSQSHKADDNSNNNNQNVGQPNANSKTETSGSTKPEVCVFDLITNPELAYCLKPLLESDKVVKIVHDVRNKSNALHVQFNIILNNVFDTQVANLVIQQQITGKPAYKSRYISMGKLCEIYGGEDLVNYRDMIKMKTSTRGGGGMSSRSGGGLSSSKDVNYWRTRPLTRPMILEATMDVYCLIGGIYQNLKAQIKLEYKPLFDLLNLEGVLARIKPEEIKSAKKERKIDMEVIDLKRKLYSDSPGPVVLSNREIRLLRHVDLTEEVRQKIRQCKKVAKKLERLDMKASLLKQQQLEADNDNQDPSQQQPTSLSSPMSSLNSQSNSSSLNIVNGRNCDPEAEQRQEQLQARLDEFNAAVLLMEDNSMFEEFKERLNESTSLLESLENDDDDDDAGAQLSSGHSHHGSSINDCCRCQCHSSRQNTLDSANSDQTTTRKHNQTATATENQTTTTATTTNELVSLLNDESNDSPKADNISDKNEASEVAKGSNNQEGLSNDDISSMQSDSKPSDIINDAQSVATILSEQKNSGTERANEDHGGDDSDDSKSSACDMAVQCDLLS